MKIKTEDQYFGWVAIDEDSYDGPGSLIGIGKTEQAAVENFMEYKTMNEQRWQYEVEKRNTKLKEPPKAGEGSGPRTPYGLALDLAFSIVERDDTANKSEPKTLRPGLTDEYTLAKHLLIAQEYISTLKNDLEEAQLNCDANAKDVHNLGLKLSAMIQWLEKNQEDVFRRGIWEAIRAALE